MIQALPFSLLLLSVITTTAHAHPFSPASCRVPDPQGYIHVSLGKTVLRLEPGLLDITHAPDPRFPLPQPPDPGQPPGCPEHPLAQQSLIIDFGLHAWLRDRSATGESPLRELSVIHADPGFWGLDMDSTDEAMCKAFVSRRSLGNGLRGCVANPDPQRPDRAESGSWRAAAERYSAPFGKPFIVGCIPDVQQGVVCTVAYKWQATVNIVYRFSSRTLPLEQVIEFDKVLRQRLNGAQVTDYPWKS